MDNSYSSGPTGFWILSMHLPSKMEVWQVSVCSLQAPLLTNLTPPVNVTSISSSHSHHIWTLINSWLIPALNLCLCHATHLELISPTKMWLSKTSCNSPSYNASPVTHSQRWPVFPLSRPLPKMDWWRWGAHFCLYSRQIVFLFKWDETICSVVPGEEEGGNQWSELPIWGEQRLSEGLERKEIWRTCPSLFPSPRMSYFMSFKIQLKCYLLQKHPSSGGHILLSPSTVFCNHECNSP